MEMAACNICGKIFGASGRAVCPACRKLLDIVYDKARAYLRDNPKEELRAQDLADAIGENVRLVEVLVAEGRFQNKDGSDDTEDAEERKKKKLLEALQKNLSAPAAKKEPGAVTYGRDRHGRD